MLQICVENINNKTTDLMLVQSPYFFVLLSQRTRTCCLGEPQRLERCLNPSPPTTNWGCLSRYVYTEHQVQSLYQDFHQLPSKNCHHIRYYFVLSAFQPLGFLQKLCKEKKHET